MQSDLISLGGAPATVFDSGDEAADTCARDLSSIIGTIVRENDVCRIAVCGGTAARRVIARLADIHRDFANVEFYLVDERCVAPGDANRNDQLLIDLLVDTTLVDRAAIRSIPVEDGPFEGAATYASLIEKFPHFDIVFLSMGDDGHVGSIFPDHVSATSRDTAVAIVDSPRKPPNRVSLSINTMRAATHRLVAAFGTEKSAVVARIHDGWEPPAVQVQPTRWYLDRAAARDIHG